MPACFIVRAQVVDSAIEDEFDRWYQNEHLPDALEAFNAHYAVYEFDDVEAARAIPGSPALRSLVAEFDRMWGDKVTRVRDIVDVVQTIGG
jgi:hypothetical protein